MAAVLITGCGDEKVEYEITAAGEITAPGEISFLDYSINVYKDQTSNSCGSCADQPVHLYVGDDSEDAVKAVAAAVERADDRWEVVSCEGNTVLLREKTAASVDEIPEAVTPEGLNFITKISGGGVRIASEGGEAADGGSDIAFPENPERIAAVYGPSYELLTMLGAEDLIVVRADVQTDDFPWAEKVFSRISEIPVLNTVHTSVNFEELMKYDPQIVYTFPRENELNQLRKAGVPALAGTSGETLDDLKKQVRDYAETLGGDAVERGEAYCDYFDYRLSDIKKRTSGISEEDRPRVYSAGVDVLTTYGRHSDMMEVIRAAGGTPVSESLNAGNRSQINYEQLMKWDPEVIFIDHGGMNDGSTVEELKKEIMSDPAYSAVTAVKNGEIYLSPSGVFYWDMGIQKILLVMNMAKLLHPDLFEDLNMENEIMEFYKKFFDYDLTGQEADWILNRLSPEGR